MSSRLFVVARSTPGMDGGGGAERGGREGAGVVVCTSVIHLGRGKDRMAFCLPVRRQPRRGGEDICHRAGE